MKRLKRLTAGATLFAALCLCTTSVFASGGGSSSKPLQNSYPIVLSHGLFGWGDSEPQGIINILYYFGGLDDYLRSQGATVYAPAKTAAQTNEIKGAELKAKILTWMAANGYSKVNIIGHSQGGLDARHMVSNLGMAGTVGVLTTVASPHQGSPLADILQAVVPSWMQPFIASVVNAIVQLAMGGNLNEQDSLASLTSMSTAGMAAFNANTPDRAETRYFSYGSKMTMIDFIQHPTMSLNHPAMCAGGLVKGLGCQNDGLVNIASQKWGTWKGQPSYPWYVSGVDHLQSANGGGLGEIWFDVEGWYLDISKNAMNHQ